MLNIAILNGGRGAASLIPAMLRHQGLNVTSIVNAYDDGKSTGEIRRFFDMLGPSDIRKVQELMLPEDDPHHAESRSLFAYRYPDGSDRDAILADMRAFAGGGGSLAGIEIASDTLRRPLRQFVREFVEGLTVIEQARVERFQFSDCSLMNCLYAGAYLACERDLERTAKTIDRLFRLKGTVLPNSVENKWLMALRENGEMLYCEAEIVELRSNVLIESIFLLDRPLDRDRFPRLSLEEQRYFLSRHHAAPNASPGVRLALEQADIIVYSAGTQHSSLYPTYMSRGVADTIARNRAALKIFVTNIGADYETPTYRASDYLRGAYKFLRLPDDRHYAMEELFSAVLINNGRRKAGETYVDYDEANFADMPVPRIVDDFESESAPGKHDGAKVTRTILALYEEAAGAA
ncbi:MAG: 2-phospho-L-lactate transferase CofD family protein [Sphingomonadales bacterium]